VLKSQVFPEVSSPMTIFDNFLNNYAPFFCHDAIAANLRRTKDYIQICSRHFFYFSNINTVVDTAQLFMPNSVQFVEWATKT